MDGRRGARVTKHDAERKRKILDYIAAMIRSSGVPPSVREIAKAVGLASTSAVHHHLQILEKEGYLERGATQSRALRLTPTTARDGDIVVAQVEENAVTLKRFFREKDRVRLQPANPEYPAQFYPSVRIQG